MASREIRKIDLDMSEKNVECGFAICQNPEGDLQKGPQTCGHRYGVQVDISCPSGYKPTGIFHTHPMGHPKPSTVDKREARRLGIKRLCIGVPQSGQVECYDIDK